MTNSQTRALVVFIVTAILIFLSNNGSPTIQTSTTSSSTVPSVVRPVEEPKIQFKELDADEMVTFIMSTLNDALRDYPVQSVRQKLDQGITKGHEHGLKFLVSKTTLEKATMGAYWFKGKPYIKVYVDEMNKIRKFYEQHPDMITDEIIAATLHEFYHLFYQDWIDWEHAPSREVKIKIESEAWWYVTDEVYWPMIRGGRLSSDPSNWHGSIIRPLIAHKESVGDPNHPTWQTFIEEFTQ